MKEYSSKTYLKDVVDYEIKIYCKTNQYYLTIKKIINIKSPFIIKEMGHDIKLLDNNYYIMEYIPCGENYFCRLFINEKKEIKEFYYQFTEEQGIENSIPFYVKNKIAYVKTQYGEKVYSSTNSDLPNGELEFLKQNKLNFDFDYKKYLW